MTALLGLAVTVGPGYSFTLLYHFNATRLGLALRDWESGRDIVLSWQWMFSSNHLLLLLKCKGELLLCQLI